jgi:hypothetical protein
VYISKRWCTWEGISALNYKEERMKMSLSKLRECYLCGRIGRHTIEKVEEGPVVSQSEDGDHEEWTEVTVATCPFCGQDEEMGRRWK